MKFTHVDWVRNQFMSLMKKYYPQFVHLMGKKGELQWHWDMKSSLRMEMKYRTRKFGYVMYLVVLPVVMIAMYFIYMLK